MDYRKYWELAIDYHQYQVDFESKKNNPSELKYGEYIALNHHRSQRIEKRLSLDGKTHETIQKVPFQHWLVISEHWCGDAAQIVPIMNKLIESSQGKIKMKLIYRDIYPKLIDAHLTNGGKAVPKIIRLDPEMQFIRDWGPRPAEAQKLAQELRSNPETASNYAEPLHKWYALDEQKSSIEELIELAKVL
jgi:hypothetical protein